MGIITRDRNCDSPGGSGDWWIEKWGRSRETPLKIYSEKNKTVIVLMHFPPGMFTEHFAYISSKRVLLKEKFLNRVCGLELFFSVSRSLSGLVWAYLLAGLTTITFPTIQHTRCSLFPVHQEPHYLALDSPQIKAWDKNVSAVSLFGRWLQEAGAGDQAEWNNKKEKPIWGWTDNWSLQAWICKAHQESSHDCPPQGQESRTFTHWISFPSVIHDALVLPTYRHCRPWAEQAPAAVETASRNTVSSCLVYAGDLGNQPPSMQWDQRCVQRCDEGYQGCLPSPIPTL